MKLLLFELLSFFDWRCEITLLYCNAISVYFSF